MRLSPELAAHRFGLGARPGDIAAMGDPLKWLTAQVTSQPEPAGFADMPRADEIIASGPDRRAIKDDPEAQRAYAQAVRAAAIKGVGVRMKSAYLTATPFFERLVWFWSNHLAIAAQAKVIVAPFAFDYERSAIRPHVTGTFADMLLASARHPAMLLYLDNARSTGPGSRAGTRREQGLNENYARELLELHTLGVGGGYTQTDIVELAKILTGWTVLPRDMRSGGEPAFIFAPNRHEPGPKTVLGTRYEEGEEAGIQVIQALARHPATARRIAHKFAAHFTADTPDPGLAAHLEQVFRDTGGDLGELARALAGHEAAWAPGLTKARDPIQFVTAAVRGIAGGSAGQLQPEAELALLGALRTLGQVPFNPPTPQGWPDTLGAWFGPDQVVERAEWALALANRLPQQIDPAQRADDLLGTLLSDTTRTAIARAPSPAEGLALLIASPEFMRR